VVAFQRAAGPITAVTRLPVGLRRRGGWRDTTLPLPGGTAWADVLTGTVHRGGAVPMTELTGGLPVALLVPSS
jgi:(1->4)-alpha-D-glucan 1-alpha-D-glucosylmutase